MINTVDYLFLKAVADIWANPAADYNAVFKANKLTSSSGGIRSVKLPWGDITLPTQSDINNIRLPYKRYVLLELGQLVPTIIGLRKNYYGWTPINSIINETQTIILGFSQGRMISLLGSYLWINEQNNVLLAIDYQNNSELLSLNDDIYFRFYTNEYYTSINPNSAERVKVDSFVKGTLSDYSTFINIANDLLVNNGHLVVYKNGLYLPTELPNFNTFTSDDVIDYIYDPFINNIGKLNLLELQGFKSILDDTNKVIVSVDSLNDVNYVDDIEFYITGVKANNERIGVYFPRLSPATIRMLTYRDWSLNSLMINSRLNEMQNFRDVIVSLSDVEIHLLHRSNKQYKPIINDSNFIADLMNLPTPIRKQALAGVNANMGIWKASSLEKCAFNNFISTLGTQMSLEKLIGVYTRYEVLNILERVRLLNPNYNVGTETAQWGLPVVADNHSGVLSIHNIDGTGVNFVKFWNVNHLTQVLDFPVYGNEIFYPDGNDNHNLDYLVNSGDTNPTLVPLGYGIFCYYYNEFNQLVTAFSGSHYTLSNTSLNTDIAWKSNLHNLKRFVRTADLTVRFSETIDVEALESGINLFNGRAHRNPIGMGNLSIWCNNKYMIEGLDFGVIDERAYITSELPPCTDYLTTISKHTVNTLQDGRILVLGGLLDDAHVNTEIIPKIGIIINNAITWKDTNSFVFNIYNHASCILSDGRILVIGGCTITDGINNYIYTGVINDNIITWTLLDTFPIEIQNHKIAVLPDDRIIVIGGINANNGHLTNTYILTIVENTVSIISSDPTPRSLAYHDIVVLDNGKILTVGGVSGNNEEYTYIGTITGNSINWVRGTNYPRAIKAPTITKLQNGSVLVIGGYLEDLDGITDTINNCCIGIVAGTNINWVELTAYPHDVQNHASTILFDNRVLTIGGHNADTDINYSDIYFGYYDHIAETLEFTPEFHIDVTVIYGGLPNPSLQHENKTKWGWVQFNSILNDGKYDLIMYRNKLFYVNGRAIPFEYILEKENYRDKVDIPNSVYSDAFIDGKPYAIVDSIQFTRNEDLDIYCTSIKSENLLTETVSNYLSVIDPRPVQTGIITIPAKYKLISIFFNNVFQDVLSGFLDIHSLKPTVAEYGDDDINTLLQPYSWILKVDPCLRDNNYDFVEISPTWFPKVININAEQFKFLNKVNRVMLNNQVQGLHLYFNIV